jgi:hypothetical protein
MSVNFCQTLLRYTPRDSSNPRGARDSIVVKALGRTPEDRGFETR